MTKCLTPLPWAPSRLEPEIDLMVLADPFPLCPIPSTPARDLRDLTEPAIGTPSDPSARLWG